MFIYYILLYKTTGKTFFLPNNSYPTTFFFFIWRGVVIWPTAGAVLYKLFWEAPQKKLFFHIPLVAV